MAVTDLSAETRARILEAAWRRAREGGTGAVTVKAIAADAGVSRQLVYFHYGNRAGLLTAMARHADHAHGFVERLRAARDLPPVDALEALLRAWCAYLPVMLPVARALEAALIVGDEGGEAWTQRMGELREAFGLAVERVAEAGRLAPGWSVEAAADWIWARMQPSAWDHLVVRRGWDAEDYTERSIRSLLGELTTP